MKINCLVLLLIVVTTFNSCKSVSDEPEINALEGFTKLKEGYVPGASAKIEIWGKKNFFAGYNNITVVVYDSLNLNQKITDAHIHFTPILTTRSGTVVRVQAGPVENPAEMAINGVFPGAVVFNKSTDINDSWKLVVSVHNHKYDKGGEVIFDISVDDVTPSLVKTFTSINADSTKFTVSLLKPTNPKEGLNDLEFLLNKNVSLLEWSTDDTCTIEFDPEMVDMWYAAHTSIPAKNIGNGHYTGSFDFSMDGEWKVNVIVKKNSVPVSQKFYFTLNI